MVVPHPLHHGTRKYTKNGSRLSRYGTCPLCQHHGKLVADHCHRTGLLRDPLCHKCNRGLGHFNDSPALLRTAAAYLERHALAHQQYRDRP